MKLIVGLGNPGKEYVRTLHNVGFRVVELTAKMPDLAWSEHSPLSLTCSLQPGVMLLKPQTFMNESGKSVREIADYYRVSPGDIWVIHDDLDLPPEGTPRISFAASSAGHRGVQSIMDSLGTSEFWRFRIGIGRPPEGIASERYVLMSPPKELENDLRAAEIAAAEAVKLALSDGIESARQKAGEYKNTP